MVMISEAATSDSSMAASSAAAASERMSSAVPVLAAPMVGVDSVGDKFVYGGVYIAVYRNVLSLGAADVSYCGRAHEICG
ncbi:exported hypothetical protein [Rhizobium mesoamericanum STM3625]|uniref:Uncharacterized protein n=1 Tax=Rhizobium mesoamericanum STM3625 TaxID=1211777 RepID=K0PKN2_9HYPH|nr:exported hypothetical protein [Rhizobium mesoamericanum STM3625]